MPKVFYMTHATHFYKQLHWHHTQQQQDIANGRWSMCYVVGHQIMVELFLVPTSAPRLV